jgi:glucose/arabinose dehydrogenase
LKENPMRSIAAFVVLAATLLATVSEAASPAPRPRPQGASPKTDTAKPGAVSSPAPAPAASVPLEKVTLPAGFKIALYATVKGARSLALGAKGTVFVGTRDNSNSVFAVVDKDKDGRADSVTPFLTGLNRPNGVAFKDGALYVGEKTRIVRYDGIEDHLADPPAPVVFSEGHPDGQQHGFRYMAFGPDGWLYVGMGAPCNICDHEKDEPRLASITRFSPDGKTQEVFASGVRNTVGFDWHPETKELWFTDNGRDWLGEDYADVPSDELNRAPKKGLHFGYPFCHQGDIPNPGKQERQLSGRDMAVDAPADACAKYEPPVIKLDPHVAALGMRFYTGTMFPAEYKNAIFIAQHGSWNREPKPKTGYRVMVARPDEKGERRYEPFATGFLDGSKAWGRPVDLLLLPDGSLLLSDDTAGAIYRITYEAPKP